MKKLLVVCMGNICRSPMAQVALRAQARRSGLEKLISVDSAGTHASHFGEKPDPRAEAALLRRGYEIGRIRSRKVSVKDFSKFDLIFAMDSANLAAMQQICPPDQSNKLHLYLAYGSTNDAASVAAVDQNALPLPIDVPDPYYGNVAGFERVLDLCEAGAKHILAKLATLP
jgi:protein-tyrosine phosphatase